MTKSQIISKTKQFVQKTLKNGEAGHDWSHIERVWRMAKSIQKKEGGDLLVIELAALLHDIADWKFHGGDETAGPRAARKWLTTLKIDKTVIEEVTDIIKNISFHKQISMKTLEGEIVQDADMLDALGAIGIARVFIHGAYKKDTLYNPKIKPQKNKSLKQYRALKGTTINHFYEKLLLLKDRMNTKTGKKFAQPRHKFLQDYLKRFLNEWKGKP